MEDDEAGRLAGFRARYGGGFDARKTQQAMEEVGGEGVNDLIPLEARGKEEAGKGQIKEIGQTGAAETDVVQTQAEPGDVIRGRRKMESDEMGMGMDDGDGWDFGEEDSNLLDMISRFGQGEEQVKVKDEQLRKEKKKK